MNNSINNPYWLINNKTYSITFPCYDDYNEGLEDEVVDVVIKSRTKNGYIVKYIDSDYETELSF